MNCLNCQWSEYAFFIGAVLSGSFVGILFGCYVLDTRARIRALIQERSTPIE